ncbi:MAG: hypothetical protein E7291_03830 [Lachnospiraceae bacterium]|nr:hypothetical protein [Lachnospiraceae bacterium]
MWEGSYGKEPFDLRLTVLRFIRNLDKIFALTVVGALLFGGGYYVKNVLFRGDVEYTVTSTYRIHYTKEPVASGDYYFNEVTVGDLVHVQDFIDGVEAHLQDIALAENITAPDMTSEEISAVITGSLATDWHIPSTTIVTNSPETTLLIARAVERAMMKEFVEIMTPEVSSIVVIDAADAAEEVIPDVRPVRALVLSAILSFFFITVVFLLKEIGGDSIWLPATLRKRYGLSVLGTVESPEMAENVKYLFAGKNRIAVCAASAEINPADVVEALQNCAPGIKQAEWIPTPAPLLCPEVCETMRKADGILLAVPAGEHVGKPLEYVLEYMKQQDCVITAVVLWEADEALLKAYYRFPKRKNI